MIGEANPNFVALLGRDCDNREAARQLGPPTRKMRLLFLLSRFHADRLIDPGGWRLPVNPGVPENLHWANPVADVPAAGFFFRAYPR
jgi:hypothetical protein